MNDSPEIRVLDGFVIGIFLCVSVSLREEVRCDLDHDNVNRLDGT